MTAKSILGQALEAYTDLTTLLGTDGDGNARIYQSWHDSERGYPQLTVTRLDETGQIHGDNAILVKGTPMQVDVWVSANGPTSPTAIELKTKEAIESIAENQRSVPLVADDTYDATDKVYRIIIITTIYE